MNRRQAKKQLKKKGQYESKRMLKAILIIHGHKVRDIYIEIMKRVKESFSNLPEIKRDRVERRNMLRPGPIYPNVDNPGMLGRIERTSFSKLGD